MSYQYKKSSILYELEQAIKKKVAEKPKPREISQKNVQNSLDKRKVLNQRQSVERLPSKHKQTTKPSKQQNFTLFNNQNLLHVQVHHTDSKSSQPKKINNRKIDKLFSLINYALSSADKAMKYINFANFQGEFAVKLFKSDKQNLMNEMRNLSIDDLVDSSQRDETSNKMTMPSIIILQEENLKLKKELAILEKQNERSRSGGQPKDFELALLLREIQIQKYKQSVYRVKGHDFLQKLSNIIEKELKYENLLRKGHASATQFDSIFRSLISERNNLCKQGCSSKTHEEQHSQHEKISKIRQEKQELMREIETCKKKLGEITQISILKSEIDGLHRQNQTIYNTLIERLPEQADNEQIQLPQLLLKALDSVHSPAANQYESQLNVLRAQITIVEKQVQEKEQNIRDLDRQLSAAKQQLSEAKWKQKKTELNAGEVEKQNQYLIGKVEELEDRIRDYQRDYEGQKDGQQNVNEQNERLSGSIEKLKSENQQLAIKLQQNEQYINQLHSRMTEINQENAVEGERRIKEHEEKLKLLESSKDKIINQLQKDLEKWISSMHESKQKEAELSESNLKLKNYSTQLADMQNSIKELEKQYQNLQLKYEENLSSLRQAQNELQEKTDNLEQTKTFLRQKTKQNFAKINQISSLQLNCKDLSFKVAENQQEIKKLKEKQEEYIKTIENLEQKLKKFEQLEQDLVESQEKIEQLEQKLKKQDEKQKIQSKQILQMQQEMSKKVEELGDKEAEILDKEYVLQEKQELIDERENSIKEKEKEITELSEQLAVNSAQLKDLEGKLEKLRLQNEQKRSQIEEKSSQLSKKQLLLNQNLVKLNLRQNQLSLREQNLNEDSQITKEFVKTIGSLETEKATLIKELEQLSNSYNDEKIAHQKKQEILRESTESLQKKVDSLLAREQQLLQMLSCMEKKYLTAKQQKIVSQQQLEQLKVSQNEMVQYLKNSESRISQLQTELQNKGKNSETIQALEQEKEDLKQEIITLKEQTEKQLNEKTSLASKKQAILLQRCGMLDRELIIKSQALDEAAELQSSLSAEILANSQTINQLTSRLASKEEEIQKFQEQAKGLKEQVQKLGEQISQKQQCLTHLLENPPKPPKSDAQEQNLQRLLDTIQSMEQQIQEYACQQQQRQKQKQEQEKVVSQLQQEVEQRKAQNSELEQKYAEVVLKLQLTLINMEQMLEEKDRLEQQLKDLSQQLEVALENNKLLQQWKNIQTMYEKQYCNLIKRILRAIIDLDELGNVDQMTIRTLLELGSQKVIQHRMKVRDQQSNEKKMRKEVLDQQQQRQSSQQKKQQEQDGQLLTAPFEQYQKSHQKLQTKEGQDKIIDEQPKEASEGDSLKDINQFQNVEGMNNSLISEDFAQPEAKIPSQQTLHHVGEVSDTRVQEVPRVKNQNFVESSELQNHEQDQQFQTKKQEKHRKDVQIQKDDQSEQKDNSDQKQQNLEDFNDYQSEKLNQSMVSNPHKEGEAQQSDKSGLGFDEFNNFNQSELDSSLISQTAKQDQENSHNQQSSIKQENTKNLNLKEQLIPIQPRQPENQNTVDESEMDRINKIGMDLSHISSTQPQIQAHSNSMQFQNFLDFQANPLNQSMISQKEQGKKDNQQYNNFNDFNDLQSEKLNESMLSQKQLEIGIKVQKSQDQDQPAEKSEHSQTKPIKNLQLDNFDDFNSQKMNDSIISNQERVDFQGGSEKQKQNQADLDEFGDFKADEMNSSLLSDKDIAEN